MRKIPIVLFCSIIALITACSKNDNPVILPEGSISIHQAAEMDTIEVPLSILSDSTVIIDLHAALSGNPSPADHWVTFAVDTTKMDDYRFQYGDADLLPATSYLFYKGTTRLPSGAFLSDAAQLNIGLQTKLMEYSTYVLPIVIQSVDGQIEGPAVGDVLYLVFKTGRPLFISKQGWSIEAYSSHFSNFLPSNVLDNNTLNTYWATDIAQSMPQWVTINFNREITFSAVNYSLPTVLQYPNQGGYPTLMQIETSMDGTSWENNGTFTGAIVNNLQTLNTGLVTARYLRFTSLESVRYASLYNAIFISDISLVP